MDADTGGLHLCPFCSTPHHLECWVWVGGCAVYGCSGAGPGPPDPEDLEPLIEAPLPKGLIIRSVLASSGIRATLDGENASTFGIPLGGLAGFVKVLVEKSRRREAREALEFEKVEGLDFGWDIGEEP
jgi:hypothetical protein